MHPRLSDIDAKCIKICTIILIGMMTLALKVLAMFTLSMGTLFLESVICSGKCYQATLQSHMESEQGFEPRSAGYKATALPFELSSIDI